MTPAQIINVITISGTLPFSVGLVIVLCHLFIQKNTPKHQTDFLERFSRMAAQHVAYEHKDAIDKKILVIGFMSELYKHRKLKLPSPEELDIAAGSALFEANGLTPIEA
jgi:hypothetical protein